MPDKNNPKESFQDTINVSLNDSIVRDTMDVDSSITDTSMVDAEKKSSRVQAYDKLTFGMQKNQVNTLNRARQKIGNYNYHFSYLYNGAGELYKITIKSDPVKTLYYETHLQSKYSNLCKVIAEKYGKKSSCGMLPSIFDVMNAKLYKMRSWQDGDKKIILYLRHAALDLYIVECSIVHETMEKEENKRLYRLKNKHIIESSKKF